jgi:RHS repeat-associated protein
LGSVLVETGSNGALLTTHSYWPFGEEMTVTSSSERYRFAGHERDQRTGYDYMHARYYAPMAGRFFSVDPGRDYDFFHPQSFNLYAYVRGNVLTWVDPNGARSLVAMAAAGAAELMDEDGICTGANADPDCQKPTHEDSENNEQGNPEQQTKTALATLLGWSGFEELLKQLWVLSGLGNKTVEYGTFIWQLEGGSFFVYPQPSTSGGYASTTIDLPKPIPDPWRLIANVHTHPNKMDPRPSRGQRPDSNLAPDVGRGSRLEDLYRRTGGPRFVITFNIRGVYVHDFKTGVTLKLGEVFDFLR